MELGLFYLSSYETVLSDKDTGWRKLQHSQAPFKNSQKEMQRALKYLSIV